VTELLHGAHGLVSVHVAAGGGGQNIVIGVVVDVDDLLCGFVLLDREASVFHDTDIQPSGKYAQQTEEDGVDVYLRGVAHLVADGAHVRAGNATRVDVKIGLEVKALDVLTAQGATGSVKGLQQNAVRERDVLPQHDVHPGVRQKFAQHHERFGK
jgi:hypothetical protein